MFKSIWLQAVRIFTEISDFETFYKRKLFKIDLSKIIGFSDISKSKMFLKSLIAELLGTFLLIFIGVASTVPDLSPGYEPSVVQIGFTFGLVVATLVQVSSTFFY